MKFKNSIRYKHGTLTRGDKCIVDIYEAVYLGSYDDGDGWVHLMLVKPLDCEQVLICITDANRIVCHQQQEKPILGQLVML